MEYQPVYPHSLPSGVILEKNIKVTMSDGVNLAVDIYKPSAGSGPWPVILAYSPFRKERIFESAQPAFYCPRGYVCVQASERGIGFNQGRFDFHSSIAARDGYELIEWIASQPWCNGNVAMMGASGYGVNQWITAPLAPPHLKALVVLGTTDNYRGLCYPGGILRKPFVMHLVSEFIGGALWPGPVPGKEAPIDLLTEILRNNEDGLFWWEHGGGWRRVKDITVPVLNVINTPNRLHAPSQLRSYADIRSPKKLVIAPWTAEQYQPWLFETIAFNEYLLRWLDYWLKGIDTGIMDEPEVAIYDNGTGTWHYEKEYPIARTHWENWFLRSGGLLSRIPPDESEEPDVYHNVRLGAHVVAAYGATTAKGPAKAHHVIYLSDPLEEDVRVWGPVSLTLYASTTEKVTSDWSFFVKVGEMVPSGVPLNPVTGEPEMKPEATDPWTPSEVQIWSWGCLKAKYREVDETMSRPGMPWHPFRDAQQLKPNTIYEFQIELQPVFKTFKKGSRIWIKIASDDVLYSIWDYSSQYVEPPMDLEDNSVFIYHDQQYPSCLLVPTVRDVSETPVKPPLAQAIPGARRFTD